MLQARLYDLWAQGAAFVCRALTAGLAADWQHCFYYAGCAKRLYVQAYRAMQEREHGKWVGYYANECQTDVRQSAQVCGYLMGFARTSARDRTTTSGCASSATPRTSAASC